jgi:hypothetical protein
MVSGAGERIEVKSFGSIVGSSVYTSGPGIYIDSGNVISNTGILNSTSQQTANFNISGSGTIGGNVTGAAFIKVSGTSSQYLMADGSTTTSSGGGGGSRNIDGGSATTVYTALAIDGGGA